jgi:hypothetical protein
LIGAGVVESYAFACSIEHRPEAECIDRLDQVVNAMRIKCADGALIKVRDQDDRRSRLSLERRQHRKPVEIGHLYLQNQDAGLSFDGLSYRILSSNTHRDDFAFSGVLHETSDLPARSRFIVGDDHAIHACCLTRSELGCFIVGSLSVRVVDTVVNEASRGGGARNRGVHTLSVLCHIDTLMIFCHMPSCSFDPSNYCRDLEVRYHFRDRSFGSFDRCLTVVVGRSGNRSMQAVAI